jgi:hypothetical protein
LQQFSRRAQICFAVLLVEIFKAEPDATHEEQEEGPVDHALKVLESGAPGENGVTRLMDPTKKFKIT